MCELIMEKYKIKIDENCSLSRHKQISKALEKMIYDGIIEPAEHLPGSRSLASHLKLSREVVKLAYADLRLLGLIDYANYMGHRIVKAKNSKG